MASFLGYAYVLAGRIADGLPLLEQAVERALAMGDQEAHSLPGLCLADAYRLANRLEEATAVARRALDFVREHKRHAHEPLALRVLGDIASQRDPVDVEHGEACYRNAIVLAAALGMQPLVAHCHLGLGRLYRNAGKPHEAHAYLIRAKAMFREMAMSCWRDEAESELQAT